MNLTYKEQERIFKQYWSIIEKNCHEKSCSKSRLSVFFRDYLTLKFNKIPTFGGVFEEFKTKYSGISEDAKMLEEMLDDMKKFSGYYFQFVNPELSPSGNIQKHLKYIKTLEITVSYPFLLLIFKDYEDLKISEGELIEILRLVQSFVFRRFVCNVPTNALNKIFMTLHSNALKLISDNSEYSLVEAVSIVLKRGSSYQRFPTDEEVIDNLRIRDMYNVQKKNKFYFFEALENEYGWSDNLIDLQSRTDITIEHVFPRNPNHTWKNDLSNEEFAEMSSLCNSMAN